MKGQAPAEYLIILAIIVIIALVVVDIIGGFLMSKSISKNESVTYWRTAEIGIEDVGIEGKTGVVGIIIINNQPHPVQISAIKIDESALSSTQFNTLTITQGGRALINATGGPTGEPAAEYQFKIEITYRDARYPTQVYKFTGEKPWIGRFQ